MGYFRKNNFTDGPGAKSVTVTSAEAGGEKIGLKHIGGSVDKECDLLIKSNSTVILSYAVPTGGAMINLSYDPADYFSEPGEDLTVELSDSTLKVRLSLVAKTTPRI